MIRSSYYDRPPSLCHLCARFVPGVEDPEDKVRCAAFPDGIPDEIAYGSFDHRKPFRNEKTLFEPDEDVTEQDVKDWERTVAARMLLDYQVNMMIQGQDGMFLPAEAFDQE